MRYKILNIESSNYPKEAKAILRKVAEVDYLDSLNANEIKKMIPNYNGLMVRLGSFIGKDILNPGSKLLFIASPTTGLDHIDLDFAKKKSIEVISLFQEKHTLKNIYATAEYTMGLIFALTRNIPYAFDDVKRGRWNRYKFIGSELHGKALGIVGYGRVGEMVSEYARSFGMKVIVYDIKKTGFNKNITRVSLSRLLEVSDIISIHLPLDDRTRGMFKKKIFRKMSKRPFLINTSRGALIDEKALLWALKKKVIRGAALDVLQNELFADKKHNTLSEFAKKHSNLIITPHIAGATYESMRKTEIFIAEKIARFLKKKSR